MIKVLTSLALISLQGVANSTDSPSYNPDKFRINKDIYVSGIIDDNLREQHVPITTESLTKDLSFLSSSSHQTKVPDQYGTKKFESLSAKSKNLDSQNQTLQSFVKNCTEVYHAKNVNTTTQEAVYRLLNAVTNDLESYYNDIQELEMIRSKKEPKSKEEYNPLPIKEEDTIYHHKDKISPEPRSKRLKVI